MPAVTQYIYAFDPGKTTGYARAALSKKKIRYLRSGELEFPQDFNLVYDSILAGYGTPTVIVAETFKLYPWKHNRNSLAWNDFPAARYFGVLEWWAHELHTEFVPQSPASRTIMDLKSCRHVLRGTEFEQTFSFPQSNHETDALQHLFFYYAKHVYAS